MRTMDGGSPELWNRPLWVQARGGRPQPSYRSRVLGRADESLIIAQPYREGRVIVYPAGSNLTVRLSDPDGPQGGGPEFVVRVVERRLRPLPSLVVTLPPELANALSAPAARRAQAIAVTSGKGGVGKTTLTVNLGIALAQSGVRTAIIDADLGLANVDVMLKINAAYNVTHLIQGEKSLSEIIVEGPGGVRVVPGGAGLAELANLSEWQFGRLIETLGQLERETDVLLIDTGAGLSRNVTNFFLAADEVLLVTNPEPPATLDAYGVLKVLAEQGRRRGIRLVVNRAPSPSDAAAVADRLTQTAQRFLGLEVGYLGPVMEDVNVLNAIKRQSPVIVQYPSAVAAQGMRRIARQLAPAAEPEAQSGEARAGFFQRLRQLWAGVQA